MGLVQAAITAIETELGVPLTWPPREDIRTEAGKQADRQANIDRLRKEGEQGDIRSEIGYWGWVGEPVTDPRELVEGLIYHLGFDLAIYRGLLHGPKWDGLPATDDIARPEELEDRDWYMFEGADILVGEQPRPSIRFAPERFTPEPLKEGGTYVHVRTIPASQSEAMAAFEWERADHLRWDRERKEYWSAHPGEGR
jgi:hypothetical protein